MSSISVLATPTQIFDGSQQSTTITNQGPATIYLDSNPSVGVYNGVPMPPLAAMTWKAGAPLWAVTGAGESTVNVNTGGNIIDASRASVQRKIYSSVQQVETMPFETGAYQSLIIRGFNAGGLSTTFWYFDWYDDNAELLMSERVMFWRNTGIFRVTIPVRGASCVIRYETAEADVSVYGTSRDFAFTATAFLPAYSPTLAYSLFNIDRGVITVAPWDWQPVYIPAWGTQVRIAIDTGAISTAGRVLIGDARDVNLTYGTIDIPVTSNLNIDRTVIIPTGRGLRIYSNPTPVNDAPGLRLTVTWIDYK